MMGKYNLMLVSDKELSKKERDAISWTCFICNKKIMLFCGMPVVRVGGCCSGVRTPSTVYVMPRHAHFGCYSKYEGGK